MRKLKQSELAAWRAQQITEQNGKCPISGWNLGEKSAADHCHITGNMRSTLPIWVNAQLGRIENAARRVGMGTNVPQFLRACAAYVEFHNENPSFVIHHTFKTPEEKKEATKARAAAKRKATAAAKKAAKEAAP